MNFAEKIKTGLRHGKSMFAGSVMFALKLTYLEVPFMMAAAAVEKMTLKSASESLSVSKGKKKNLTMGVSLKGMIEARKKPYQEQQSALLRHLRKDFASGINNLPDGVYTSEVNNKVYRAIYASRNLRENPNIKVEEKGTNKRKLPTEKMMLMSNKDLWKGMMKGDLSLLKESMKTETMVKIVITKKEGINKSVIEKQKQKRMEKEKELSLIKEKENESVKRKEQKLALVEERNKNKNKTYERSMSTEKTKGEISL